MPEKVSYNPELKIIEIRSHGDVTYIEVVSSVKTIERLHKEYGVTRVLSDARDQESTPDTFSLLEAFSALPEIMKYAVVVSYDQETFEDARFVETLTYNRGINLKLFRTREDALIWLFRD